MCKVLILEVKNCVYATKPRSRRQEAEARPARSYFHWGLGLSVHVSLSPQSRKLAPSTPEGSQGRLSRLAQRLGHSRSLVKAWVLLIKTFSKGLSFPISKMGMAAQTSQGRGQALSGIRGNAKSPTASLLLPSPIAGVPAQSPPGCGAGAPLFKRAGELPRADSPPGSRSPPNGADDLAWRLPRGARPLSAPRRPVPEARAPLLGKTKPELPRAGSARAGFAPPTSRLSSAPSLQRPWIGPRSYKEAGELMDHVGQRGLPLVRRGCQSGRAGCPRAAGSLPLCWGPPAGPAACQREVAMVRSLAVAAAAASLVRVQGGEDD